MSLIAPIVVTGKLLMQKLWKENINWDDELPIHLLTEWHEFYKNISLINTISIPRYILTDSSNLNQIQLHCFSDASKDAAIYVRVASNNGVTTRLLCSRSRVSPIKIVIISRLELCAALALTKLMAKILKAINLDVKDVYYWTDSSIVLAWIQSDPTKYKGFIANRISKIHALTK